MAETVPQVPQLNVVTMNPTTGHMTNGFIRTGATLPSGAANAGLFAPNCLLQILAGAAAGSYQNVGTSAVPVWQIVSGQFSDLATASLGTAQNSTPTAAQLLGGIVTQTGAVGAGTVTLPLGSDISLAVPNVAVGRSFKTLFQNLGGGQTLTITGATGTTVIGTAAVPTGKSAWITFVNTGTNTWNAYVDLSA